MTISPGPVWPDLAGTATDPTVAYTDSSRVLVPGTEGEVHCLCTLTGTQPRALQLRAAVSYWGQVNYIPVEQRTILCDGTTAAYYTTLRGLPHDCEAIISARRWGGDATTRLVVRGYARSSVGVHSFDGQPEELALHQALGVEAWSDGAGVAVALPAGPGAHAPSPAGAAAQQWIPTGEADTLSIDFDVSGVACTTVELEVRESTDDVVTTAEQMAVNSVVGGVIGQSVAQEQVPGTIARHQTRLIAVRPGTAILILAQRTGGAAGTLGLGRVRLYRLGR